MSNKVIAISGYSGSGKTTISENILEKRKDIIYFDFGCLFRPLTYYLLNELKLTKEEIKEKKRDNSLKSIVKISYRVIDNKVEVGINNNYYDKEKLYSLAMNMDTVSIGTIIGDSFKEELQQIISELKQRSNVLLNARRPYIAYKKLDYHIFLEANFDTRVRRKMKMNNENYEKTFAKLAERDIKERDGGFWEKYKFTETIDTSDLSKEEVLSKVLNIIDRKVRVTYINNLTLVLGSYECNKNCPYCIAKNNKKFVTSDRIENLDGILGELENSDIKLNRFVISGNGEPSMYKIRDLRMVLSALVNHKNNLNLVRVHTSGHIFDLKDKFNIFNDVDLPLEFEVLRVSLNSDIDRQVLGYENDYLKSDLFKKAKNIKCDIAVISQ